MTTNDNEQEIKKRGPGRPKKYLTEEERLAALKTCWSTPERKQYISEYFKVWRENHKERMNELNRNYRARKKALLYV